MDAGDIKRAMDAARTMERKGEALAAAELYLRVGAVDDAVRVAAAGGHFLEAAQYAIKALGNDPSSFGGLEGAERKLALKAGICLAEAGQTTRAIEVFLALGETVRAKDLIEKAGGKALAPRPVAASQFRASGATIDPQALTAAREHESAGRLEQALAAYVPLKLLGDAGRVARRLGRHVEAGRHYAEAGMPFEAALCFHEGRDEGRCFEQLVRVPAHHERYRTACAQAIRIADARNTVSFQLDRLLSSYFSAGPQNDKELDIFYTAAKLYERQNQPEMALELLDKIAHVNAYFRDVQQLIGGLRKKREHDPSIEARINREDASFLRAPPKGPAQAPPLSALPDLPDLPPLPAFPVAQPKPPSGTALLSQSPAPKAAQAVAPTQAAPIAMSALAPGMLVAERYQIESKIGQGGMATVYKALDTELGEHIAMKVFLPGQESAELLTRFKQELSLSRQLSHPNVVRLYDIGTHQGCRFITMELLQGRDLGSILNQLGQPIDFLRGLRYLLQACSGLHAAHERGIVHRDIKPDNFFITTEDQLKVMDFGIAKKRSAQGVTQVGYLAGTPAYIAPEQISNFTNVTPQTDLYSIGIVAYQMFAGRVPFDHEEMMPLLIMHLSDQPPPPRQYNPAIPPELERVILRLLEKDPSRRHANCRELARAFQEVGNRIVQGKPSA